jgi:aromatic ring-cleaving dioxygenase
VREIAEITGYHAHVYFDGESRPVAERLRAAIPERFEVEMGGWREQAVGPHSKAMYQVAFAPDQFAQIVPWLMLNRGGLSILVHPRTGDDLADHETNPLWLGESLALNLEFLRNLTT